MFVIIETCPIKDWECYWPSWPQQKSPGGHLNIKMFYQHRGPHVKDKTSDDSLIFNMGNPHTWERRTLYWDGALFVRQVQLLFPSSDHVCSLMRWKVVTARLAVLSSFQSARAPVSGLDLTLVSHNSCFICVWRRVLWNSVEDTWGSRVTKKS